MEEVLLKVQDDIKNHRSHVAVVGFFMVLTLLTIFVPLILAGYLFVKYLVYKSTTIEISNKRITVEKGVLSKTLNTLELWKVNDLQFQQSLIQRVFGEGYLVLVTQDRTTPLVVIEALPAEKARAIFKDLQDHIAKSRLENRVTNITT